MKPSYILTLLGLLALTSCGGAPAQQSAGDGESSSQVSSSLDGVTWRLEGFGAGEGSFPALAATEVTAVFSTDPEPMISGSAGCNTYTASFVRDGDNVTVSMPVTTKKLCQEAGVMDQERAFLAALTASEGISITGNRLTLTDAGGQALLSFVVRGGA